MISPGVGTSLSGLRRSHGGGRQGGPNPRRGEVIGPRDVITFQSRTPAETIQAFRESIDDYLDFCAEIGREPEITTGSPGKPSAKKPVK